MKLIISLLISVFSVVAYGSPAEVGQVAVEALINVNPKLVTGGTVNSAIASSMLSSFTSQGQGFLSVSTAECYPAQGRINLYKCMLKINTTPRVIAEDGSYVPYRHGVRASTLQILFHVEVTSSAVKVKGEVSSVIF